MYNLIKKNKLELLFPNVNIALRIYLSLMVTNCSGERSFSKLKRIKNEQRTSLGQDKLNSLTLLYWTWGNGRNKGGRYNKKVCITEGKKKSYIDAHWHQLLVQWLQYLSTICLCNGFSIMHYWITKSLCSPYACAMVISRCLCINISNDSFLKNWWFKVLTLMLELYWLWQFPVIHFMDFNCHGQAWF